MRSRRSRSCASAVRSSMRGALGETHRPVARRRLLSVDSAVNARPTRSGNIVRFDPSSPQLERIRVAPGDRGDPSGR